MPLYLRLIDHTATSLPPAEAGWGWSTAIWLGLRKPNPILNLAYYGNLILGGF